MITIAIADDEQLIASSLSTLLSLEDDLDVKWTFSSGEQLLSWWEKQHTTGGELPQALVLDLQMGGIDGIDTAVRIRQLSPDVPAMIVTSHSRPRLLKRALDSGIQGFVAKTASAEDFATAIRAMHAGKRYIDPELAALTITATDSPLTDREAEVIEAAGKGGSIEEIATLVHLAPGTTRNYLSSAMSKLGAQNRFEAFLRAQDQGWV